LLKYHRYEESDIDLTIWVPRRVSYKKQKLLTLHERLGSSPARVANHFRLRYLFFCFVNLRYVSCA